MRSGEARSRWISSTAALLRPGERKGQGVGYARDPAVADLRAAGRLLHALPHQQQRELARQQFVIGQPHACRAQGPTRAPSRPMQRWRARRGKRAAPRSSHAASCHSGREAARAKRRLGGPAKHAGKQPLGETIDRLERGHVSDALRRRSGRDAPSGGARRRSPAGRRSSASGRWAAASPAGRARPLKKTSVMSPVSSQQTMR